MNALSPPVPWGLAVRDVVQEAFQRRLVQEAHKFFLSSKVLGVLFLSEGLWSSVELRSKHLHYHRDGSPLSWVGLGEIGGPISYKGESHLCMALASRAFHALAGKNKWKVKQIDIHSYSWGSGSCSGGTFKCIKPVGD